MLLVLRGAGHGVGVSCSRRQLRAAIVLLLLATCCCAQHGKAASGSWRANSEQRAAAARTLAQQPAIGDDDEFDWSTSQQQAAAGAAGKAITKPADAAGGSEQAVQQQTKAPQGSSPQGPAPAADAAAARERNKLEADAAAAAVAAAARNAGSEEKEPVEAGAPAVLGEHTVAAEQQKGPSKQRAADASKQAAQQQEAPQGQQDTTADTWAHAPVQQPAAKEGAARDDVGPEGVLCYSLVGYRGSRQHSLPCSSNNRPGRRLSTVTEQQCSTGLTWSALYCSRLNTGACKRWVEQYCEDVEAGAGQVADCLAEHQAAADSGDEGGSSKKPLEPLSEECHEEVLQLKIARSRDIGSNPKLGEHRLGPARHDMPLLAV